jgi:protocatechuate 3,4-dioxygenase beta subunit
VHPVEPAPPAAYGLHMARDGSDRDEVAHASVGRVASSMTRREFAVRVAGAVTGALLPGCRRPADAAVPGGGTAEASTCVVYPRQTEGPFHLDLDLLRSDITDGRHGVPLRLALRVVAAGSCAPIQAAVVDVWHCDAAGVYSGYPGQLGGKDTRGERFLRGSQVTDADGNVGFETIYPGWYPGRTTHVHFTVRLRGGRAATSQLYFPEEETAAVYRLPAYAARGQKDTSNAADGVVRWEGLPPLAHVTREGARRVAKLTIAVDAARTDGG